MSIGYNLHLSFQYYLLANSVGHVSNAFRVEVDSQMEFEESFVVRETIVTRCEERTPNCDRHRFGEHAELLAALHAIGIGTCVEVSSCLTITHWIHTREI